MIFFKESFQKQNEFATPFEEMSPPQLNGCLQKFDLSARKRDGSFYTKKSPTAIRAALDLHLRSPLFSEPFSVFGYSQFNNADTSLSNCLKTLSKSGQIAPTMHKQPLTKEVVTKLYEKGQQTACFFFFFFFFFFISLFLKKTSCESQQVLKKHLLVII